jgi:hypothetical protein
MRTAAKKLYTPLSEGGLGLIKINDYITALQCSWVKRLTQHWGDNCRYDFKKKCYGNPLIADKFTFTVRGCGKTRFYTTSVTALESFEKHLQKKTTITRER